MQSTPLAEIDFTYIAVFGPVLREAPAECGVRLGWHKRRVPYVAAEQSHR
jgi:hypothetical protein